METIMNRAWEKYNLTGKYVNDRCGTTSLYNAFTFALFNYEMDNDKENKNSKIVSKALLNRKEELKIEAEKEEILSKCFIYNSLREVAKKIQNDLIKNEIFIIIFNYNKKWFIKSNIQHTESISRYRKLLDKKALVISGDNFYDYTFDGITLRIKKMRDLING